MRIFTGVYSGNGPPNLSLLKNPRAPVYGQPGAVQSMRRALGSCFLACRCRTGARLNVLLHVVQTWRGVVGSKVGGPTMVEAASIGTYDGCARVLSWSPLTTDDAYICGPLMMEKSLTRDSLGELWCIPKASRKLSS